MVTQDIRINRSIYVSDPSCPPLGNSVGSAMTVEQSSVENCGSQSRESVLSQLKEVTGVEDIQILRQALEASRNESGTYDISQAVSFLMDENAVRYNQPRQQALKSSPPTAVGKQQEEDVRVIDLTSETSEKDEIQKAIALSLQDQQHGMLGGQITAEEQDISLVLEQSLAESKVGAKRKRGEVWQDPVNPYERKRQENWPVGLKNVGNTCWFSAVIQSLFHLPVFRHLVLNFNPPPEDWDLEALSSNTSEKRNLIFMQELRHLFALMVGSHRKYVDPSKAVDILKEAFQLGSTDSQQDVSEFTHKLLEWLEDAFKCDCSRPSSPSQEKPSCGGNDRSYAKTPTNPMLDLFYGQFKCEGLNDGHIFSKEEKFGQYPLQVNGFGNIHESLEAATAQEIETNSEEVMTKSGQEHWFTQLPPALLFELSRFQFNQQIGCPEKIHNKFDFPEVIYMDRYMEVNKNSTKTKREEIKRLKERREHLQSKLERFLNYGSGSKRFPLQDVLRYTLEFVESKQETGLPLPTDVEMASPSSNCSMAADSPCNSPIKIHVTEPSASILPCTTPLRNENVITVNKPMSVVDAFPSPKHISETELRVLQNCLRRWRTEVEHDVKELQDNIASIDNTIHNMYNDPSLKQVPYRLHAVLVHEGQAASGHYWAYVYDHSRKHWLKFNDITVTDATWEELQKESVGGYHNASAYCLMYIDSNRNELVNNYIDQETGQQTFTADYLPEELGQFVAYDNERFQKEIAAWDLEQKHQQQLKTKGELVKSPCESPGSTALENLGPASSKTDKHLGLCPSMETTLSEPANADSFTLSHPSSIQAVARVADTLNTKGPDEALSEAIGLEFKRIQQLSNVNDPLTDTRLQHIAVYLLANDVPFDPLITWTILEQFTHSSLATDTRSKQIRLSAEQRLLKHANHVEPFQRKLYSQWQEDFRDFRKLVALFITGLEAFHNKGYPEALPYLVSACALNDSIIKRSTTGKRRGLDGRLIVYYRRMCLLKLNQQASLQFEKDDADEAKEALQLMTDFVVPCMNLLNAAGASEDDNAAAEEIRSTWCSKLGEDISSEKTEILPVFLAKLLDPSTELKLKENPPLIRTTQDLSERFTAAMTLAHSCGCLKAAYQSR